MADTLLLKNYVIAAAEEAALGTAEALVAGDSNFLINEPEVPEHTIDYQKREVHGTSSKLPGVAGARMSGFKFKNFMHGKGSSGVPVWSLLLKACGFYDDANTFKLITSGPAVAGNFPRTLTLGSYIDGVRYLGAGCMGNVKLIFENGKQPKAEWDFKGKFSSFTDTAIIVPTLPTESAIRAANLTVSWNGWTFTCDRVEVDLQNEVVVRQDMSSNGGDAGYLYATIVDRDPIIKATVEMPLVATEDLIGQAHDGTTGAFIINVGEGAASWNNIKVNAPAARIMEPRFAERDKILAGDMTWELARSAANDDELTIEFPENLA